MNLTSRTKRIAVAAVAAVLVAFLGYLGINALVHRSVENSGNAQQNNIVLLQRQMETAIDTCINQSQAASQIAVNQTQQVKDAITAIVQARYETANGSAAPTNVIIATMSGLQTQYPEFDTSQWKNLMTIAVGCLDKVKGAQDHLQAVALDFVTWTQNGNVFTHGIHGEYPTKDLHVRDADPKSGTYKQMLTGAAALDYYTRVIMTQAGQDAINSGTLPTQNLGGNPTPAASATPSVAHS